MHKIDLFTLVAGLASIASFLFTVWGKFPKLKKYLLPLGYILLGFVFGRISFVGDIAFLQIISNTQVASISIFAVLLLTIGVFVFHYFMKKNEIGYAYAAIFIFIGVFSPSLIKDFSKATEQIVPRDYLKLSEAYQQSYDYDNAIKYLNKYIDRVDDSMLKEECEKKIERLKKKQLESLRENQ